MKRIAVYGKGGIGKSTISANLSVGLSRQGRHVLQVGCDPKHDSTRLLLGGKRLQTALDYLRDARPDAYDISAILQEGFAGVGCVEAGGPKPGVGCAGRGIISTFDLLEQFHLSQRYDTIVYDVLGDVVCGGFAVPIRREYADTVLIVTSGEFMSLYAANNILRGIRNYDGDDLARVAGLVYNKRNVAGEDERVSRFARAVNLPVFVEVPRSDSFTQAERAHMTVMQLGADEGLCALFEDMARRLAEGVALYRACPVSDEELERAVLDAEDASVTRAAENPVAQVVSALNSPKASASDSMAPAPAPIDLTDPNRYLSKTLVHGEPLHGCAFSGAIAAALNVTDAVVVAHSPASCANISLAAFTSTGRRRLYERGTLLPTSLSPQLVCTDMGEPEIVFGGTDALLEKVRAVKQCGPRAIIVVSSCPAGIIGDDLERCAELSDDACQVLPLKADGNMSGDFQQGHIAAHLAIARTFIKPGRTVRPRTVNVYGEKMAVTNTQDNFDVIAGFLARMDVEVNCRFLNSTTTGELARFCEGELNLPAYGDYTTQLFGKLIAEEFSGELFERPFPVGFDETAEWLRELGARFDRAEVAEQLIAEQEERYHAEIARLRPALSGKKLMVVTYNCELDWILRTALDLGMDIVRVGILNYSQDTGFRTRLDVELPVIEDYARDAREGELEALAPDVFLTNYATPIGDAVPVADTIPMCPDVGFLSSIAMARRWERLLKLARKGGWKNDGRLFEQAFL